MSSSLKQAKPAVVEAKGASTGTVIFLHGLGDSSAGWLDAMEAIQVVLPHIKFILPNAPERPITCNMGMRMPGWYDILDFQSIDKGEDEAGMEASKSYLLELVKAEIAAGTPSDKIILGGFSQGGAMSYHTVYSSDIKFAGTLVMSGYLPLATTFTSRLNSVNIDTPLMACHGTVDPVVPFSKAKLSFEMVEKAGIKGTFHEYKGMGHSAVPEELGAAARWIHSLLSDSKL